MRAFDAFASERSTKQKLVVDEWGTFVDDPPTLLKPTLRIERARSGFGVVGI